MTCPRSQSQRVMIEPQFATRLGQALNHSATRFSPGKNPFPRARAPALSGLSLLYSQKPLLCGHRAELLPEHLRVHVWKVRPMTGAGGGPHLFYITNAYVQAVKMSPQCLWQCIDHGQFHVTREVSGLGLHTLSCKCGPQALGCDTPRPHTHTHQCWGAKQKDEL